MGNKIIIEAKKKVCSTTLRFLRLIQTEDMRLYSFVNWGFIVPYIYIPFYAILPCLLISSPQFFHKRVHGIKWDKKGLTCDGNVYKCTICEVHMSYARRNSTIRMALSKVTQLKKMNDSSLGSSWSLAFNSSSTMTWELAWTAQVFLYV